jgi:hypothetical protein
MKNVKLPSGFVKVERTEEERRKSFSASGEFVQRIQDKISREIAEMVVRGAKRVKGGR